MNNKSEINNGWLDKDDNGVLGVGETESLKSLNVKNGNKNETSLSGPLLSHFGPKGSRNTWGSHCRTVTIFTTVFVLLGIGALIITLICNEVMKETTHVPFERPDTTYNKVSSKPCFFEEEVQTNSEHSIESAIVGYWIEEKNRRNNFEFFLSELRTDIDVNETEYSPFDWESEKMIYLDDCLLTINEVRPNKKVSEWKVQLNNETQAKIDIEQIGVFSNAIARMSNDYITLYVFRPSSREILLIISYTMDSDNTNILHVTYEHIASKTICSFLFKRKYNNQ